MAINKNFVIKNGVQVSTDLIIGDADTNKVGIGTTVPGYDLHVGVARGSRGGIGATDLVVSGVATVTNLDVTGLSTFAGALNVDGTVDFSKDVVFNGTNDITYDQSESALVFNDGAAIRVGTSSDFSISHDGSNTILRENGTGDLQIYASRIELGGASVDETMAVFTENSAAELWFNNTKRFETVGHGATVFGDLIVSGVTTSQKLNVTGVATVGGALSLGDNIKAQFGTGGDLLIYHDSSNSYIDDQGTGDLIIRGSADIKLQSASGENYIIANDTGSVEQYFDNSKKTETTSGGFKVTGITTLTDRLHVQSGISTFDADVRFGIGATVGFGTSAFFRDDAAIFLGNDSDLKIHHDGSNSRIQDVGTGDLILQGSADIKLQSASAENYIVANDTGSVDIFFDNSKKVETTSGGLKVTGITTLTDRLHVEAGISTFDADVRFGIGATVGFGTSAFFRDDAAIFMGNDSDLKIHHDGSNSRIQDVGTGDLILQGSADIKLQSANAENYIVANDTGSVEIYFDNSKKLESTSGGLNVTGITTFSDRINVVSGVSTFQDDAKLTFGAQSDLLIQHDGTDTEIYNKTGNLKIRANDLDIQDYTNGHSMITADRDGSVDLFYDNYNALQTTPQGINVSGVTTSNRLNISGVSTFTSIGSNLIPDTDGSRNIGAAGSEWQDLHIDGTANIDTLDVDATSNFADDVTLVAAGSSTILFDASGLDLTFQDNIRAKFGTGKDLSVFHDGTNSKIVNSTGELTLESNNGLKLTNVNATESFLEAVNDGSVSLFYDDSKKIETTSGGLNVTGITTISDRLQVTSGISTFYDTTQSTSATTGAVIINGGVGIAKNVNIGGNLTVTGTTTFNGGTITLGDANTDNVVFSADVDSSITPDDDDTYDLGSSTKEWQDLFIDGTAHIDTLDVDETAFVTTSLSVGTGVTAYANGNLAAAGIVTANGGLSVGSNGSAGVAATIATNGNAAFSGIVTVAGISQHRVVIGGANGELIDDGNLSFNTSSNVLTVSGSIDLSTDIDVDGTANLDTLDVDGTADFADDVTFNTANGNNIVFDKSANHLIVGDAVGVVLGDSSDFVIQHTSGGNFFEGSGSGSPVYIRAKVNEDQIRLNVDGSVELYHDNAKRFETTGIGITVGLSTVQHNGNAAFAGITTLGGQANAVGGIFCSTDGVANGVKIGAGEDLILQHNGTNSFIDNNTGDLYIQTTGSGDDILIEAADNVSIKVHGSEDGINITGDGSVQLYHDNNERLTTTDDGVDIGGTGSIRVPNGTTDQRNGSPAAGDFRYNTTTGKFEGYTDSWGDIGGSGGVDENDTSVSTTSATSCGSFAKATFRSAAIIAQITQGSNYQVGRYLLIHDGTTVTTLEESAVATGSMLGTFEGVINGSNVEFRVTMGSSSSATVTTKIDTVTV